jgi:hypothetical protein
MERRERLCSVSEEGITPFRNRKSLKRRRLSIKG